MRSCISAGVSRCMQALIQSGALASVCVCAHVYVCAFVCLKTILLPHYLVSCSPALMRCLTVTVVIKVKPRPKHRGRRADFAGPQCECECVHAKKLAKPLYTLFKNIKRETVTSARGKWVEFCSITYALNSLIERMWV